MEEIRRLLIGLVQELYGVSIDPEISRTDEKFGDYATNIALQLAGTMENPPTGGPRAIAETIADRLKSPDIANIEIAGPGFFNIKLTDEALVKMINAPQDKPMSGKVVVAEYSDPNPFKVLHAGHLYTSIVGDAIASLLELAGASVHRVNFGGDVGLHVGKTMWAIIEELGGEDVSKLSTVSESDRSEWLTKCYIRGTAEYEDNEPSKAKIIELNRQIYKIHASNDQDSALAQIYWTTRGWSYDYFNAFYERIGSHFEKYYPESEVAGLGLQTVLEQLEKGVFQKSDGAIIFDGEKFGLHARVFINSKGLPTYEAKDVGLIITKWNDYHFDKSVVITGNEQEQYMAVVLKAIEQFRPELSKNTTHLTHGIVKLSGGVKMSSRQGNILRAVDVLDSVAEANRLASGKQDVKVELGAVKYAFLKQRTGGDIIFDPQSSVSLEGNSGPYLQYAHVRANSILNKAPESENSILTADGFEPAERTLVRKISEYPEVVQKSITELMPHHICTYLYELAQDFNRFYENNRVIDDPRQSIRLQIVKAYAETLKHGLNVLNIPVPESM